MSFPPANSNWLNATKTVGALSNTPSSKSTLPFISFEFSPSSASFSVLKLPAATLSLPFLSAMNVTVSLSVFPPHSACAVKPFELTLVAQKSHA